MAITVKELIARLQSIPEDWMVDGNHSGSLTVSENGFREQVGKKYGYVFTDDRPTNILTHRKDRETTEKQAIERLMNMPGVDPAEMSYLRR